ncbi:copper resistance CopC family protein [Auraticoccus cholistanensis]|uniref:copper resistance CopC family protein n=1 Tax=Auraticoccus cholistanensis TaxID=2656650 RepID=UPI0018D25F83
MPAVRQLVLVLLLALVAALAAAPGALAHGSLVGSAPAAGQSVPDPPREVVLSFSDPLLGGGAAVVGADGRDRVSGEPRLDGRTLVVELGDALPDGEYEVRWQTTGSDGHPVSGVFSFTVGHGSTHAAADPAPHEEPPPAREGQRSSADAVALSALLTAAGTVVVGGTRWLLRHRRRGAGSGRGVPG